jgi:hypothetical protein
MSAPRSRPSRAFSWAAALTLAALSAVGIPVQAQGTPTPATDPVRAIAERNIFNPSRVPRSSAAPSSPSAPPSPIAELITLVGVLDDGRRRLALFDGTSATLRQALKVGGDVAGLTLTAVDLQQASLAVDGQTLVLRVGASLAREPGGPWRIAPDARAATSTTDPAPSPSVAPASPSSDPSDALRRLKERRRKQLKE